MKRKKRAYVENKLSDEILKSIDCYNNCIDLIVFAN